MIELTISQDNRPDRRMLLKGGVYALGRHEHNDIVLDDKAVSRQHARLLVDGDVAVIEDLESGSGTFIDGRPIRELPLGDGIVVEITPFRLMVRAGVVAELPKVSTLTVKEGTQRGHVFELVHDELTIGRGEDQDVRLDDHGTSRGHALLVRRDGVWFVRDAGSANGVFINDQQVSEAPLGLGDELAIGHAVLVLGERELASRTARVERSAPEPATAPMVQRVAPRPKPEVDPAPAPVAARSTPSPAPAAVAPRVGTPSPPVASSASASNPMPMLVGIFVVLFGVVLAAAAIFMRVLAG